MPAALESHHRPCFFDLDAQSLREFLAGWGWPAFRAAQVAHWVYRSLITDPLLMSNLPSLLRQRLKDHMVFESATITRRQDSNDGTIKLLLTWPDGKSAETVMIPDGPRLTACVSSQVGCPVGCRFCASGMGGVRGNLSAGQIVEQVHVLNRLLPAGQRITNVVFMGMGEPLANYANTTRAVRILHDPAMMNLGARRITISTVGVPARIRDLAAEGLPVNLALSLHAPDESLRRNLIPWADHFALQDILDAVRHFFQKTGREITLEYILLSGVNDRPEHARRLAQLCATLRANVNLIRYNEVDGLPFGRPKATDVLAFQRILRDAGVNVHVRKSRGRDIDAACGQLRRREQQAAGASQERTIPLPQPAADS